MSRTPGPWRAIETDAAQGTVTWRIVADTEFGNLQGVALVTWWERANTGQRSPETDANAAFIVEACNAHDGLVKRTEELESAHKVAYDETIRLRAENERLREHVKAMQETESGTTRVVRESIDLALFAIDEGLVGNDTESGPTYKAMRRALTDARAALGKAVE